MSADPRYGNVECGNCGTKGCLAPHSFKMGGYDGVDTFVQGIGTVRECIDCSALIPGGPTRCMQCTKRWVKALNKAESVIFGGFWSFYWSSPRFRRALNRVMKRDPWTAKDRAPEGGKSQ